MELHCIRHGETRFNLEYRFNGWIDDGITEAQAKELRSRSFDSSSFDAIYCSPLKRCIETAQALGVEGWIPEPRIRERNLGIFEGKTMQECEALYPKEFQEFMRFEEHFQIPQGESRRMNLDRVLEWLEEIQRFDRVLAFTHGGPIDLLYRIATASPLHGGDTIFAGENARRSIFRYDKSNWSLVEFDGHLT